MAASLLFLAALAAAFHFGRQAGRDGRFAVPGGNVKGSENASRQLLLPSHSGARKSGAVPARFTELRGGGGRLAGWLFLEGMEACANVLLDARNPADRALSGAGGQGFPLEPGEHILTCADGRGNPVYRERISMLPFQRKIVRIRPVPPVLPGKGV